MARVDRRSVMDLVDRRSVMDLEDRRSVMDLEDLREKVLVDHLLLDRVGRLHVQEVR